MLITFCALTVNQFTFRTTYNCDSFISNCKIVSLIVPGYSTDGDQSRRISLLNINDAK